MDLFEIRRRYTEIVHAKIDALRALNDEDQTEIERCQEVQKSIDEFGNDMIRAAFRRIDARNELILGYCFNDLRDIYKPATPEIVAHVLEVEAA